MSRELYYQIQQKDLLEHPKGLSIEQYLRKKGVPHTVLYRLKNTEGGLRLNGCNAKGYASLQSGDLLKLTLREKTPAKQLPQRKFPLSILYEDEDYLVINKPSGLPIHSSIHHYEDTLANGVTYYMSQKRGNEPFIFRCVNRLDRDTTGLTVIALNGLSASLLSTELASRNIHRTYLAVTEGLLPESGSIHAPIGRKNDSVILREVREDGEDALTHYQRLSYGTINGKTYSLARIRLETGRTHQIRVHMGYIGHPLPGDFLYNPDTTLIARQALHAYELSFRHPISKEVLSFRAPIPEDIKKAFGFLLEA